MKTTDHYSRLIGNTETYFDTAQERGAVALEEKAKDKKAREAEFGELYGRSAANTHILPALMMKTELDDAGSKVDHNFTYTPEMLMQDWEETGLPEEWMDEMEYVVSDEHRRRKLAYLKSRKDDLDQVFAAGGRGYAAFGLAILGDPLALAAEVGGGRIATIASAARATRARRALNVALAGGGTGAAVGSLQSVADPDYDLGDLVLDSSVGAVAALLSEASTILKATEMKAAQDSIKKIADDAQKGQQTAVEITQGVDVGPRPTPYTMTASDAGSIIDEQLAALEREATNGLLDADTLKSLGKEEEELTALLRSLDKDEKSGIVSANPTAKLSDEEKRFVDQRRIEIRQALEGHRRAVGSQNKLDQIRQKLDGIDSDGELLTLARALSPRFEEARTQQALFEFRKQQVLKEEEAVAAQAPADSFGADSLSAARSGKALDESGKPIEVETLYAPEKGLEELRENLYEKADLGQAEGHFKGIRFDLSNQANKEADVAGRAWIRTASADAVGLKGAVNEAGFVERSNTLYQAVSRSFLADWGNVFRGYLKDSGKALGGFSKKVAEDFNNEVGLHMKGFASNNPHVQRAAARIDQLMKKMAEEAKRAGVKGAEFMSRAGYLPRLIRREVREILEERLAREPNSTAVLSQLIGKGIRQGLAKQGRQIDDAVTDKVATHYAEVMLYGPSQKSGMIRDVSEMKMDHIAEVLEEAGIDQKIIDDVLFSLEDAKPTKDAPKFDRLKHRLEMDETAAITLSDGSTLTLADLFETNAENIVEHYVRETAGRVALAEDGYANAEDFLKLGDQLRSEKLLSDDGYKAGELLYRAALGKQLDQNNASPWAKAARLGMNFNFIRTMGSIAFSMAPEIGNVIGTVGLRAALKHMPSLKEIPRMMREGTFSKELMRELASATGVGGVTLRASSLGARPDLFDSTAFSRGVLGSMDKATQVGTKMQVLFSGMGPLNDFMQHWLMSGFTQRMYDNLMKSSLDAAGDIKINKAFEKRLASYGLGKADLKKIKKHFETHARLSPSGTLSSIAMDKMDPELYRRFSVAMNRVGRHAVQELDAGHIPAFMHKTLGKVAMQFRTFSMGAYARQTLYGISHLDATLVTQMALGSAAAYLSYNARIHLVYGDDEKRLEEALAPERMSANVAAMLSQSSIVPWLVDTMAWVANEEPVFGYNRGSNLATDFFTGNPTVDLVKRAIDVPRLIGTGINPRKEATEQQLKSVAGIVAFAKLPPILYGMNKMIEWADLPNEWEVNDD